MAQQKKISKKVAERKWKGKDWFNISAPDWLGCTKIAESPATDSKSIAGRVFEIPVSELTKDQSKYYMRLKLRAEKPQEMEVATRFHSFFCVNEYVMRMARKGVGKVPIFVDVETKDKWKLQVSIVAILNRRSNTEIKKKVRVFASKIMETKANDLNHGDFVKAAMAGVFQMKVKKGGSKIYPIRFAEVIKIETLKTGD
jgi:small subunit ribosomal protein S3Ae